MTERDFAEWDAEIEADFQRVVAATRAAGKTKRGRRIMAAPMAFWADVCRLIPSRSAVPLIVAVLIYRRTIICRKRTVTLPGADLVELGIDRPQKSRALVLLAQAGLIRIEPSRPGQTSRVTLLWEG